MISRIINGDMHRDTEDHPQRQVDPGNRCKGDDPLTGQKWENELAKTKA